MENEVREAQEEAFDYITLSLGIIGLAGGMLALILEGPASLWFLRFIALLAVVLIAFVLRRTGQFAMAAYVLVLELIGLVAGMFLQINSLTGFIPYLFIPPIIIAGLILSRAVTLAAALFSMAVALIIVFMSGQFTLTNLLALLPPFSLLLLTALLATVGRSYVARVDRRLLDSKNLLRERTLELLRAREDAQELQTQAENLKEQLSRARSEAERIRQRVNHHDQRLSDLIGGAVQELKVSLKGLEQVVAVAAQTSNGKARIDWLPEAWQQIDHLAGLVISLEEMIKLESDDFQLDLQPVDTAQLLGELVQTVRGLAREKKLEVRYTAPPPLPPLLADPAWLRQALLHLFSNAVKYTDQGMIEVQTELLGSELVIFISDTGVGMSNEELDTIFQTFSRGQKVTASSPARAGLGLPLSKRIIERHGGRLWATTVLGVGSTFSVALPLQADAEKTHLSLPAVTLPATALPRRERQPVTAAITASPAESARPASPQVLPKTSPPVTAGPGPGSVPVNFGPVARFSPVYISRFGLTLLGLLLLITGLVLALALINGLNPSEAQSVLASPAVSAGTSQATAPKTPQPVETIRLTSTSAPSATPAPTRARPTATPTTLTVSQPQAHAESPTVVVPSATPTPSPTHTSTATSIPSPPALPTTTPTSPPTPTPSPTLQPAAQPKATEAASLTVPSPTPPAPALTVDPLSYPALLDLSFEPIPNTHLIAAIGPAAASRLSWLRRASGYEALFSGDLAGGDRDLYLAPQAGQPLNLTQTAGDDLQPALSPDKRRIAFTSGRGGNLDIYVMDADGGNVIQLTTNRGFDEWPAWSPDGGQIAFVSDRDGNVEIYGMNSDGSNQQRLTGHPADDWPVVWSPDGRTLLFASNRDGNWNLFVLELPGGKLTRLTNDPGDEREPAWSPDGRTIAFTANSGSNWDIYTLPAPTGAPTEIPRSQWIQVTATSKNERYPAWLP
ncbi:MAG: PD40 domain-containing protein [Anaerolineae bacterium]|nr:PD40 domain-containing protein [Anaerolineae bacterium]